mmetsp:Transcript_2462/g.7716  ORF Transcript_2462/g.7716 Transcript_2462/m.7716 type:complete len:418 (+) Transcript_2462:143-1396(+)
MMEIKPEQDDANFATEAELQEIERLFSEFVDEATVMVDKLPKEQADSLMKEVVAHNDGLAGMIYQHAVSNATSATRLPEMSQISSSELKEAERLVSNAFHEANSMLDGLPQAHAQVILQDLCEGKSELAIFLRSHILKDKRDSVQEFDDNLGISNSQNLLDELEAASSSMMEKLPESYARILVEGIKHGQSPLCRAVRHQINQRYIAGRLQEDPDNEIITDGDLSLASFHQRLDEIFLQMSRSIQELQEAVQGLKISLLEKEREVESLQQQLKHLPVIRVMEILHADGTKSADYQYNCLSLQDEELLKMKREADESRRKAEEAAQEVERARREAAEEEFRFEAAKAEVILLPALPPLLSSTSSSSPPSPLLRPAFHLSSSVTQNDLEDPSGSFSSTAAQGVPAGEHQEGRQEKRGRA